MQTASSLKMNTFSKQFTFRVFLMVIFFCIIIPDWGMAQLNWSGWHYSEFANYTEQKKTYYENWSEIRLNQNSFNLGMRFEMHIPSHPYSPEKNGRKLSQLFLNYRFRQLDLTVGNFYKIVGRGLVLQAFENRSIRWDTNILGADVGFSNEKYAFRIFGGKPRDRSGQRIPMIYGGSLSYSAVQSVKLGMNLLSSRSLDQRNINWGSVSVESHFDQGNMYAELAYSQPFTAESGTGNAVFVAGDLYIKDYTLHLEYKNYHLFQLSYGSLYNYNNLPTAFREHLFTLLNRKQHLVNGNNETGFMVELSGPIRDEGNWLLNVSQSFLRNGNPVYREYYSQIEWQELDKYELIAAGGLEEDLEASYKNGVISALYYLTSSTSLKFIMEHQHETILFSRRKFYNQLYTIGFSYQPIGTIAFIMETTRDQLASRSSWSGIQLSSNSIPHSDINVFIGKRREGKICAGGVCVYKPEFSGVELTVNLHFP